MKTPETADNCAELVNKTPEGFLSVKPDKGHWQAFCKENLVWEWIRF